MKGRKSWLKTAVDIKTFLFVSQVKTHEESQIPFSKFSQLNSEMLDKRHTFG